MGKRGKSSVYLIAARGELSDEYACAFEGMRMQSADGQTILAGEIVDQPHLLGILQRINGLGLELLSVEVLSEDAYPSAQRDAEPYP
jgi:hypothetical protein